MSKIHFPKVSSPFKGISSPFKGRLPLQNTRPGRASSPKGKASGKITEKKSPILEKTNPTITAKTPPKKNVTKGSSVPSQKTSQKVISDLLAAYSEVKGQKATKEMLLTDVSFSEFGPVFSKEHKSLLEALLILKACVDYAPGHEGLEKAITKAQAELFGKALKSSTIEDRFGVYRDVFYPLVSKMTAPFTGAELFLKVGFGKEEDALKKQFVTLDFKDAPSVLGHLENIQNKPGFIRMSGSGKEEPALQDLMKSLLEYHGTNLGIFKPVDQGITQKHNTDLILETHKEAKKSFYTKVVEVAQKKNPSEEEQNCLTFLKHFLPRDREYGDFSGQAMAYVTNALAMSHAKYYDQKLNAISFLGENTVFNNYDDVTKKNFYNTIQVLQGGDPLKEEEPPKRAITRKKARVTTPITRGVKE